MEISFLKTKGGSSIAPNVFLQQNEPETKEGIWLQDDTLTFDNIAFDTDISGEENWDIRNDYAIMPGSMSYHPAPIIGNDIYLFGIGGNKPSYKYNIINDSYTKISDYPYSYGTSGSAIVSIGTDIYILGGGYAGLLSNYKYDTLKDIYTQLSNIPYTFLNNVAATVGTNIYLFGSYNNPSNTTYKYDTLTGTYTKLTNLPYNLKNGAGVTIGTDIYLFGSSETDYYTIAYKYNTVTDTYTKLTDIPDIFYGGSAVAVGNNIYLFGGNHSENYYTMAYKYNIISDTYTKLDDIPKNFYSGAATNYNDEKIYLFGCDGGTKVQVFLIKTKTYEDNSILISQGVGDYATQLVSIPRTTGRMLHHFHDAWHYTQANGLSKTIPTYYGNGTEWIKFKN